jgi:hypothetical protein
MFIEKTCSVVVFNGFLGSKYLEYVNFQDQEYSNNDILTITELMKQ